MAKKKQAEATAENQELTLFRALAVLGIAFSNEHLFRELAKTRETARKMRLNRLEQWEAPFEAAEHTDAPRECGRTREASQDGEVLTINDAIRRTMIHGTRECGLAMDALRAGGAKGLDAATQPNEKGQPRSIELHMKLQDAESAFSGMMAGLDDPRIIIDNYVKSMADLSEWFAQTCDEMHAVFETREVAGANAERPGGADAVPLPGGTRTPTFPCGIEPLHEHDMEILAFLNKTPGRRRMVADVLPEDGPNDRKAVAKRLRKLADRIPPLVDYPKGTREGVAITSAGIEALKHADPPTPR